jgi:collagen triple helix repeat protein
LKLALVMGGVLIISGGATAGAASLISGSQIKKNSIPLNRLSKGTQKKIQGVSGQSVVPGPRGATGAAGADGANGAKGDTGATGAKGDTGPTGAKGDTGTVKYVGAEWGQIDRNTEGSPVAQLRSGPFSAGGVEPPMGVGSLGFNVKDGTEKVAFGNQVDFAGDKISAITDIGFSVFWTNEDRIRNANNMPNITFEIDPTGPSTAAPNYSSLVFVPNGPANVNTWTDIDATATAAGWWYFSNGTTATAVGCGQSTPPCSFDDLQTKIAAAPGYENMAVSLSLAVGKGKDHQFQGAVDALRYNDEVYDFEPFGVTAGTP